MSTQDESLEMSPLIGKSLSLPGVFPVSTGVVVAGLAKPEWLLEVDVIAVIPEPVNTLREDK